MKIEIEMVNEAEAKLAGERGELSGMPRLHLAVHGGGKKVTLSLVSPEEKKIWRKALDRDDRVWLYEFGR